MTQPLVIIGTGLAGYMLAKEWRKLEPNHPLHLITLDDGSFYSKPLLSTALTHQKTPAQLVVSDVDAMAEQLNATISTYTTVKSIDVEERLIVCQKNGEQKEVEFSHLVFACGAKKIIPAIEGDAVDQIHSVNSLEDYRHFQPWVKRKKHVVIIGSGLVGCEFSNDLINSGFKVTVVAPESYPLARFVPEPIGQQVRVILKEKGVEWRMGHLVTAVNRTSQEAASYQLTLSDGSEMIADGVFCAIGIRPNIDIAKAAGIETKCGIVVNQWLQTSVRNIFALGDCAEVDGVVRQYVAPILHGAKTLAHVLAGGKDALSYPVMPIVVKTPACPLVFIPPPHGLAGDWSFEGEGVNQRALFHDQHGQLRGFSLLGANVREKMQLIKELPLVV